MRAANWARRSEGSLWRSTQPQECMREMAWVRLPDDERSCPANWPMRHRADDVAEGERRQERPQRRGRVGPSEDPLHSAVPQQRHVLDTVRAGDQARDQGGDLQPSVRALVGRHTQMLVRQVPQPRGLGQREHRNQATGRHEIWIIEGCRGRSLRVREFHLRDVPCVSVESLPEELRFSRHARAFSFYGTLNRRSSSVDPG